MKKIGLWKKLASWLLVFLLVLQIPVNVFAEGWISETDISADNDFLETENAANVEEEENTDFVDDEKIEETENDGFTDSENLSEEENTLFNNGTDPEESNEEAQEVQVILTANLLGYPYSTVSADPALTSDSVARDPKVLLRYVQLSSVLPVAALDIAPWRITDPAVAAQCKAAFTARERIGEYYRQLIQESARTAEPIVRHMEYEFPRNGFTDCNDQFMIGSKSLVAPLLGESDSRTVRFPRGVWISRKGERFKGPLVTTVTVADGEIPIFESSK